MALRLLPVLLAAAVAVGSCAVVRASPLGEHFGSSGSARRGMLEVVKLDDGTVIQAEEFPGPPKASALPYLFTSAAVEVHCPAQKEFAVYTGPSMPAVRAAYGRKDAAWCGLAHWLGESPNCSVPIPPYGTTFVAVAKPRSWIAGGASEPHACQLERREALSMARMLAALMGGFLFWYAGALSESTPFRLTGGTLGFMALSSIILLFVLYRRVPHKGKLFGGAAVFGSSFLASMRWLFGVWLPSSHQLLRHPLTQGYLALSALAGLALTYYYNNTENRKVNTMLRVALQMVGLSSVYFSTSMPEASIALCAGLLGAKAWGFLHQHRSMRDALASAKRNVQHQLGSDSQEAEGEEEARPRVVAKAVGAAPGGRGVAGQPAYPAAAQQLQQQQQQYHTPVVGGGVRQGVPEVSPLIQRGLILNEETGHIIGIGKATYNRLVDSGYIVDQLSGTITPPPPSPESPARPARGSGRARRRHTP